MKKIRIYALPSHQTIERTTGVDFARIIQPMQALNGYKDKEVEIETHVFEISEKSDWLEIAKNYDVIYFNYLNSPWGFAAMGAMARKLGKKIVMDLDDNLWNIQEDNPAHAVYKKGSQEIQDFTAICNEVDYMTTTTGYLRNVILNQTYKRAEKVKIFPNYIDLKKYTHRNAFKDAGRINLIHFGSTTHFIDLSNSEFIAGVDKIMREYPNVTITMVGAFLPKLRELWGARLKVVYGDSNIYTWIEKKFPEYINQADILVVPLEEHSYTRSKSNIKFLEASSAKIPGVWQDIKQYHETITHGYDGMLARTSQQWYEGLKKLIDDATLRKQMGENAYKTIATDWQIQDHVQDYANFFKSVLDIGK